ncbi:MAG: ABC transporter ATP-binding protein, partial [Bdellovibrionales bacterium]|nr:ABC transporter ATP-binding protein [Bdellovibrionales bacterium]
MIFIKCNKISKVYVQGSVEVRALRDVSVEIDRGEFLSLHGPSGSGKTTLLNLIGGLDQPTSGTIEYDEIEITKLSKSELAKLRLEKLGFIFQSYNLIPVLSARENVEFVLQLQGVPGKERFERAMEILKAVGLDGLSNRRPAELSGGQQQRVAVARAMVTNPTLILADEPTANLDSSTATKLLELMKQLNDERKITFI